MSKKDSHFIKSPFKAVTEYENEFVKAFNENIAGAVTEVLKNIATVTASAVKNGLSLQNSNNDIQQ